MVVEASGTQVWGSNTKLQPALKDSGKGTLHQPRKNYELPQKGALAYANDEEEKFSYGAGKQD